MESYHHHHAHRGDGGSGSGGGGCPFLQRSGGQQRSRNKRSFSAMRDGQRNDDSIFGISRAPRLSQQESEQERANERAEGDASIATASASSSLFPYVFLPPLIHRPENLASSTPNPHRNSHPHLSAGPHIHEQEQRQLPAMNPFTGGEVEYGMDPSGHATVVGSDNEESDFFEDPEVVGLFARRTNPFRGRNPEPTTTNISNHSQTNRHLGLALPSLRTWRQDTLPPAETHAHAQSPYPGDGMDFRRIVVSAQGGEHQDHVHNTHANLAAPPQVIDLTDEDGTTARHEHRTQRLPRFQRNIIDVEDVETAQLRQVPLGRFFVNDEDDEIVITDERSLNRPAGARSRQPLSDSNSDFIDLTDDDVVHLDTRSREGAGINAQRPGTTAGVGTHAITHADALAAAQRRHDNRPRARVAHAPRLAARRAPGRAADIVNMTGLRGAGGGMAGMRMEILMEYDITGFDLGLGRNRPPSPKYEPPPEVEAGFTRNPGEAEEVVCPNCGDELCVSGGTAASGAEGAEERERLDVKRQIWVVKGCGHVYCGTCATGPRSRAAPQGKGKGKVRDVEEVLPLKKCVVDGCGKNASKNAMVHVYLGN